jgi:hypothetical protein
VFLALRAAQSPIFEPMIPRRLLSINAAVLQMADVVELQPELVHRDPLKPGSGLEVERWHSGANRFAADSSTSALEYGVSILGFS